MTAEVWFGKKIAVKLKKIREFDRKIETYENLLNPKQNISRREYIMSMTKNKPIKKK